MKIYSLFFLVSSTVSIAACASSVPVSFFPVEGPIASENSPLELIGTAHGITGNTGDIELTMPDGATCAGKWSSAAGSGVTFGSGTLLGKYGSIHGTGVSVSHGSGQNPGAAFMNCSDGRTIKMEFVTGAGTANGFGFAEDNQGNIYRVLF